MSFSLSYPVPYKNGYLVQSKDCPNCGEFDEVFIDGLHLMMYQLGADGSEVLENYPLDVVERFITGICPACWEKMFPEE